VGTLADPPRLHVSSSLDRNLCAPCTDVLHFDGFILGNYMQWGLDRNALFFVFFLLGAR
jgi:hypothetical protein